MTSEKPKLTIGAAIDQLITALSDFEERDQRSILTTVCDHLQIKLASATVHSSPVVAQTPPATPPGPIIDPKLPVPESGLDIRALKEQKQPTSAREMACIVAYYLQDHAPANERKDAINTEDLEKYFKQAGFKLPAKMGWILRDSKKGGYFDSAARGAYKLTRVGYNLVMHSLPHRTAG